MVRRWIIVLAVVVALGVGLVVGHILPPRQKTTVILEGSAMLSVGFNYMSEQEYYEWREWQEEMEKGSRTIWKDGPFPVNRLCMHANRFFLQKNEVVEVVIRSPEVMAIDDVADDPMLTLYLIGIGSPDSFSYAPPSTLDRANGNWELRFTIRAESDGYHVLSLINGTPNVTWCQYAVLLRG